MGMNIVKGKIGGPLRAVIYGPESIGKSTLASKWPNPVFFDCEDGTKWLDVNRVKIDNWLALVQRTRELTVDQMGFKTLVIDTSDWAEKMLIQWMIDTIPDEKGRKVDGIEGYGFGKGYVRLSEEWKKYLDILARLQDSSGMNIVFLSHAKLVHVDRPDEEGSYDRWELKMGKQSCPLFKEWSDLVLFLNYKVVVVSGPGENDKAKATGGKRVMYTEHHPAWDAKNRFDLPKEIGFDKSFTVEGSPLAVCFGKYAAKPVEAKTDPKPSSVTGLGNPSRVTAQPSDRPVTTEPTEHGRIIAQIGELMLAAGISAEEVEAYGAAKGIVPAGAKMDRWNDKTLLGAIAKWEGIEKNIKAQKGIR